MEQEEYQSKSLWEILGLGPQEASEQQLVKRRVVIVGDALGGKRTFATRLFAAAMQHFPSSTSLISFSNMSGGATGNSNISHNNNITNNENIMNNNNNDTSKNNNDNNNGSDNNTGCGNLSGDKCTFTHPGWRDASEVSGSGSGGAGVGLVDGTVSGRSPMKEATRQLAYFPHGAGIAQTFLLQRIPARRNSFPNTAEEGLGNGAVYNSNISSGVGSSLLSSGVRRAMTEFFCCDAPGALSMALPTLEALETSVVLIVVDTSVPWRLQDQLQRWYGYLNAHVVQILQVELPKQDEVRRMRMIEQQQRFWQAQQQVLGTARRRWIEREGILKNRTVSGDTTEAETNSTTTANNTNTNTTSLPALVVPKSGITPLRTILVCTKTDQLEKLSRELDKFCRGASPSNGGNNLLSTMNIAATPCAFSSVRSALRTTGLSLLDLVGQLLRKEAIEHQSALVGTGSRVNTTATSPLPSVSATTAASSTFGVGARLRDESSGVSAPSGPSTFVHPFYKNLWTYLFQLLYEIPAVLGGDGQSVWPPLLEEMDTQFSAQFHPHAFLPHGSDHLELLSPFLTSTDAITLNSLFARNINDDNNEKNGEEMDDISSALLMREKYMKQIESLLAATGPEEDVMIWDKL
ncbi:Dynein family light intermediate chain [Trypanosoma melophagium]|uniref:Dynein family light intermediate chain n=1 Tax=Trypanosoma melophagium TaxID=715481 RepID=UPI00351A9716|nr:Dynein family light intermediate chain [Trypanosoma melophagium]